jgi:8-oxo-dGTP diphosphatase
VPTLYLIRHAKAEPRERWASDDAERPLTRKGLEQARVLASQLSDLHDRHISRIVSSEAVRCRQTVANLSESVRLPIVDAAWLMEGSDTDRAFEQLRKLTRRLDPPSGVGGPVAACTHGDVIWGILDRLHRLGVDLGRRPDVPKGSVWIIEVPPRAGITATFFQPDGVGAS